MKTPLLLSLLGFLISNLSCQLNSQKQISKAQQKIQKNYLTELQKQENDLQSPTLTRLRWNQALLQMQRSNSACLRSAYSLQDAKVRQKQLWRQFVPGLNVGVSDNFEVGNLADAFTDPSLRINSFLALGNLLDLPKNIYERKLYRIGAELSQQYTTRQQVIALYRIFEEGRLLELQKDALNYENRLTQVLALSDPTEGKKAKRAYVDNLESYQEKEKSWQAKTASFFNQSPGTIDLILHTNPKISYHSRELNFADTNRWGRLQMKILALRDLADSGRIKQAYLRYLPRASLGVSAPAVYSNTSNESFDPAQIRLGPSVNWSLDSRGTIGQQVQRLKREKPLKEWEKDKRTQEEIRKLLEGRQALQDVETELRQTQQLKKEYRHLITSGLLNKDPESTLHTLRKLHEKEIALTAKKINISTNFWLIDDAWWAKHSTLKQ